MATKAQDVIDSFESSFRDKAVIPLELELLWLRKAVSRYSIEIDPIEYNAESCEFAEDIDGYAIDILAAMMKQSYQEREVSKVNKRVSIVGKDLSINAGGHQNVAARNELLYDDTKVHEMLDNLKPTAYV
jgi:hypothetical protein